MNIPFLLILSQTLFGFNAALADITTTIVASSNYGVWEGWGTSLAWWAAAFGDRDDLANAVFSLNSVSLNGVTLPGLGMNIVRYNAGASSSNSVNGEGMIKSPSIIPSRLIDGYWIDWTSSDPASSSWLWSQDAKQRSMMQKAKNLGANLFELFSNSPMWWMCSNHNPSGSDNGSSDNLQNWNHQQFAVYLSTIALYAKNNWGITFNTVEPFNEPASNWWNGRTGTQEGCHFSVATQQDILPRLRSELNSRGLTSVQISASDETNYDTAISTWKGLNATAKASVAQINVHGYQHGSGDRSGLYSQAVGSKKKLWNSEYGENDATGSQLISDVILDFRWLHPTAWVYWQIVDGGGWGLITGDNDARTLSGPTQKYFILALLTRHIRAGMRILDSGCDYAVAAYDTSAHKLVIVAVNWGNSQYLNFDLSQFGTPGSSGATIQRWSTQIGSGERYATYKDTTLSGSKFWSYFAKNQVQTFEVPGVYI
ncbi:glycoside hydrolase superfamily [Xylaria bambusicola]|uniref:glycoside hydrolase superfamily n=1 Tax=Xylaria bambusicola TaxID=326684 RepID=UPI002007506B|nr:glycoside hydrolase superfamily [Xylaria bambusicola]KAI0506516.1 glycoside hydrolase superfamily [Xylaria bambusicola]